jgi:hypothetical protein
MTSALAGGTPSYEKRLYASARIDAVLKNYFDTGVSAEEKFTKYLNKKSSIIGNKLSEHLVQYEVKKYELILSKLENMLDSEQEYNEAQWQKEILEIVLLLYPKYIHVFENTPVKDPYSDKVRKLDFLLVDAGGSVDVIEIKKPFDNCIITDTQYRDNHTLPLK